ELPEHDPARGSASPPGEPLTGYPVTGLRAGTRNQRITGTRPRQQFESRRPRPGTRGEFGQAAERSRPLTSSDKLLDFVPACPTNVSETNPHLALLAEVALHFTEVDVGRLHFDPLSLRLVNERVGRIEAHRLLVQQRAQKLRPVVDPQPGRLVGE